MSNKFPTLPVLNCLLKKASFQLDGVMIVAVQHLLETTGSLLEALIQFGISPDDIHILGKMYSTNKTIQDRIASCGINVHINSLPRPWPGFAKAFAKDVDLMWDRVQADLQTKPVHTLIVIDDGGRCIGRIPSGLRSLHGDVKVIGVEQTTSGLPNSTWHCPLIRVADAAAKIYLESPLIGTTVISKLCRHLDVNIDHWNRHSIGIVGVGNVGRAIADELDKHRLKYIVHDKNRKLASLFLSNWCDELPSLVLKSDYIFGCTGEDIFRGLDWVDKLQGPKTFISCSSEDREFYSLLQHNTTCNAESFDPLTTVNIPSSDGVLTIFRGGFPVNFDGSGESVPAAEIQLTRGLLFSAVMQAVNFKSFLGLKHRSLKLDAELQAIVVHKWFESNPSISDRKLVEAFNNIAWISDHSGGHAEAGVPCGE